VASSDEANELRKFMSDSIEFVEGCKKAATAANEAAGDARHEAESAYDAANKANKAAIDADNATQRASDATQDAEDAAGRADAVSKTVQSKLDNGEFNGAQGPEGPKGDKGDKGDPGQNNINDDTISMDSTWSSAQISAEISDCVNYSTQNKADSQKAQARENIGAIADGDYVTELTADFLGVADSDDPSAPGSKRAAYMRYWGCRDDGTDMIRLIGTESETGNVAISGVAPGMEDADAVNKKQLDDAIASVGGGGGGSADGAVLYTEQILEAEQKAQARENIGAVDAEKVEKYIGDIETALDSVIAIQNELIGGDGV
jgi:hypothetical protein